ncbi:MAG: hypothetical protein ABWW65_06390 [Thermoprotei archaeon]
MKNRFVRDHMVVNVKITIRGKPCYEKWSIYQWILDYKDILEREYGVVIDIDLVDSSEEYPIIIINNRVIGEPPFEEGYVIEFLKKALDEILKK